MRWPVGLIVLGVGLAGCSTGFNMHPFPDELQAQAVPASYCYQTLTQSPDCYDVPLNPEARRLMGYQGPDPEVRGFFGRRSF